jgi:hypothetical protein
MIPCRPAITFCSIVGHAIRQTAAMIGPSMIERSNLRGFPPGWVTEAGVYYVDS